MTDIDSRPRPSRSRLAALRVGELRDLAAALGVGNTTTMRKGTLVDAINERYDTSDTEVQDVDEASQDATTGEQQATDDSTPLPTPDEPGIPGSPEPTTPAPDEPLPAVAETVTPAEDVVDEQLGGAEGLDRAEAEAEEPAAADETEAPAGAEAPQIDAAEQPPAVSTSEAGVDEQLGGADLPDAVSEQSGTNAPRSASRHVNAGITGIAEDLQELQRREGGETPVEGQHDGTVPTEEPADGTAEPASGDGEARSSRRGRGRGRGRGQSQQERPAQQERAAEPADSAEPVQAPETEQEQAPEQQGRQQPAQQDGDGRRGRYRDRKRRGQGTDWDEPEIRDDDVLIPIAGILDVLENYAFVRTSGYLSGANDVYVSLGQVKKYHLRRGDAVVGAIRQVGENEQPSRQKYNALVKVDSINGLPVADAEGRVDFEKLSPLSPQERLRLETDPQQLATRVVDLVAPVGKGQRGLVVAPPKAGKTVVLQAIANAVSRNNPEVHLMVVLVDERPEEVTEMQRTVKGEVIASTFDRPAEDHTTVAELAIERAKRLVELGYDVVVLLDSITRLTRAFNQVVPQSGRVLPGGVDHAALHPVKRFFGAARNIENGGSLTIVATALAGTGSATDEAILEEFAGTANMELRLDRALADRRIYPAVDVTASGTYREETLMGPDEVKVTALLRRALAGLETAAALDLVLRTMRETGSNVEFLVQMQKSLPNASGK